MDGVTIVKHPMVQHKLTLLRKKSISTKSFRELLKEIGMLLCYEITRDLPLIDIDIETPLAHMKSPQIAGKKLVFAPVLRAGVTFAEGIDIGRLQKRAGVAQSTLGDVEDHHLRLMLRQVPGEIHAALFQVRELAPEEAIEARSVEHALNHLSRVGAGVEQRDDVPRGGRSGLDHFMNALSNIPFRA